MVSSGTTRNSFRINLAFCYLCQAQVVAHCLSVNNVAGEFEQSRIKKNQIQNGISLFVFHRINVYISKIECADKVQIHCNSMLLFPILPGTPAPLSYPAPLCHYISLLRSCLEHAYICQNPANCLIILGQHMKHELPTTFSQKCSVSVSPSSWTKLSQMTVLTLEFVVQLRRSVVSKYPPTLFTNGCYSACLLNVSMDCIHGMALCVYYKSTCICEQLCLCV